MANRLLIRKPLPQEEDARYVLTVSRHWHSPKIEVYLHRRDGIGLQMLVADVVQALLLSAPWYIRLAIRKWLPDAMQDVIEKMKQESIKAV